MVQLKNIVLWSVASTVVLVSPLFAGQATPTKTTATAVSVNLNTASQADLEALPAVGAATAKKIIAGRPYASIADLAKAGISKSTIDKISPLVTVGGASRPTVAQPAPTPAATVPASVAAPPTPSTTARATSTSRPASAAGAQPPVAGMVWVNLSTKVFHREGDRYYGKTKDGKFMTEAEALKAGYREAKTGAKPK